MFTGIVREIGTVAGTRRGRGLMRLSIVAPRTAAHVGRLESVAVAGVCLSVVRLTSGTMEFEAVPETLARTTLGRLKQGARVNLELSLTLTDRLNGHLVFGHVDGMGTVVGRTNRGGELVLRIRVPPALRRGIIAKGPITVDGVSLTVGPRPGRGVFSVHLIPETLRQTTLGERRTGDAVNLEIDYIAKLVLERNGLR